MSSLYQPSQEEKVYIQERYADFDFCRALRQQSYVELDDLTPERYWDESRKRAKNYLPPLSVATELSNIFLGKTRNKRNVIAAFAAAQRPRAELSVRSHEQNTKKSDKRLTQMSTTATDHFLDKEKFDKKFLDFTLEVLDVGTAYWLVDYEFRVQKVKDTYEEDHATGKKKWKYKERIVKNEPITRLIPVEDVFFPDMYQRDIQEQPYIFIREILPRRIAEYKFGSFSSWEYVPETFVKLSDKAAETDFFTQLFGGRIEDGFVEVLHYMNKWTDEHSIFCNGVLMTDLENPIRFDHHKIPLVKCINESIGPLFAYGMSLPMKVVSEQDAFNELGNNNLDRSRISSIPKAISNYETELEVERVGAFEIVKGDGESGLRELSFDSVKNGDMNFMQFIERMLDEATVDKAFSGSITGVTAAEIMNAKAQNQQALGPLLTYLYTAAQEHAELYISTLLQYFFMTSHKWKGKDFDTREIAYTQKLQDGLDGTRIIRVLSSSGKKKSKEDLQKEMERGVVKRNTAKGVQERVQTNYDIIEITPEEIANVDIVVRIVPGSSLPETKSLMKALYLELAATLSQPQFAPHVDFKKVLSRIIGAFNFVPEDILREDDSSEQLENEDKQQNAQMLQAGKAAVGGRAQNSELIQSMAQTKMPDMTQLLTQG
jgi:hypothetical protein